MGTSAIPLYDKFVKQAKKMSPRFLSMIIPARWFSGGKGLDEFRNEMLNDKHITHLTDDFDSTECFPGVDISGGICYFLWERDRESLCEIESIRAGKKSLLTRPLLEKNSSTFIRFNEAVPIIRKILQKGERSFADIVSARKPFGFGSQIKLSEFKEGLIKIYSYPQNGYVKLSEVEKNKEWINLPKVMIAKAYGERGSFPVSVNFPAS